MENRQQILDALNSLEVTDRNGGDDAWALVENNEENRARLREVGVTDEEMDAVGDEECFCIYALAFNGQYANWIGSDWKLIWSDKSKVKVSGEVVLRIPYTVRLDMTEEAWEALSDEKQNQLIENELRKRTTAQIGEVIDDIDVFDVTEVPA